MRSVSGDFQRSADCGGMRGRIGAGETGPSPGGWINWSVFKNMERLVDHRLNQRHQGPGCVCIFSLVSIEGVQQRHLAGRLEAP